MKFKAVFFGLLMSLLMRNGQIDACHYNATLNLTETYFAHSPKYPSINKDETFCTWEAQSPHFISINCTIEKDTDDCSSGGVRIIFGDKQEYNYCNKLMTPFVEAPNVTIIYYHKRGLSRFKCELKAKPFDECKCPCGWKNSARTKIVGGTETGVNEYPMMAGIVDATMGEIYCGGTIINDQYLLTAAHCINNKNINTIGVVVGEHDVTTGRETDATRLYRIAKWIIHPNYTHNNTCDDIAIIKVKGVIIFSEKVGPACLPFQYPFASFVGITVTAAGWGLVEFGGKKSNTLDKVYLKVIEHKKHKENYCKNMIYTFAPGKDACQMDSGGPLLWLYTNELTNNLTLNTNKCTNRVILVGIINSGTGCASDEPGVAVNVKLYINWIVSETGVKFCEVC